MKLKLDTLQANHQGPPDGQPKSKRLAPQDPKDFTVEVTNPQAKY